MVEMGWSFPRALYFSVSTVSTAGLQSLGDDPSTSEALAGALFVAGPRQGASM